MIITDAPHKWKGCFIFEVFARVIFLTIIFLISHTNGFYLPKSDCLISLLVFMFVWVIWIFYSYDQSVFCVLCCEAWGSKVGLTFRGRQAPGAPAWWLPCQQSAGRSADLQVWGSRVFLGDGLDGPQRCCPLSTPDCSAFCWWLERFLGHTVMQPVNRRSVAHLRMFGRMLVSTPTSPVVDYQPTVTGAAPLQQCWR